jgi:hypothetical protein
MESSSSDTRNVPLSVSQRTLHVTNADEEDESVKQLNECATIYLSLQALASLLESRLFPSIPILGLSDFDLHYLFAGLPCRVKPQLEGLPST